MSVSTGMSYFMTQPWQLFMSWGLLSGIGSGAVANVLGATIVNRWFTTNRGLVMGLLTASRPPPARSFSCRALPRWCSGAASSWWC